MDCIKNRSVALNMMRLCLGFLYRCALLRRKVVREGFVAFSALFGIYKIPGTAPDALLKYKAWGGNSSNHYHYTDHNYQV